MRTLCAQTEYGPPSPTHANCATNSLPQGNSPNNRRGRSAYMTLPRSCGGHCTRPRAATSPNASVAGGSGNPDNVCTHQDVSLATDSSFQLRVCHSASSDHPITSIQRWRPARVWITT